MWNRQQLEKLDADRIVIFAQLSTLNNELKTKKLFHIPSEDRWIDQWPFFWSVFWNINKNLQVKCMAVEGCIVLTKQLKYLSIEVLKKTQKLEALIAKTGKHSDPHSLTHTRTDTSTVTTHTHIYMVVNCSWSISFIWGIMKVQLASPELLNHLRFLSSIKDEKQEIPESHRLKIFTPTPTAAVSHSDSPSPRHPGRMTTF